MKDKSLWRDGRLQIFGCVVHILKGLPFAVHSSPFTVVVGGIELNCLEVVGVYRRRDEFHEGFGVNSNYLPRSVRQSGTVRRWPK